MMPCCAFCSSVPCRVLSPGGASEAEGSRLAFPLPEQHDLASLITITTVAIITIKRTVIVISWEQRCGTQLTWRRPDQASALGSRKTCHRSGVTSHTERPTTSSHTSDANGAGGSMRADGWECAGRSNTAGAH